LGRAGSRKTWDMKITSLYAAMVLAEKKSYLGPGHIKHGWVERLFDAAQETGETYKIRITIHGHLVFEKSCPLTVLGFIITKSMVNISVHGKNTLRIKDKWTEIAEKRFNVPITLSWDKHV